MLPILQTAGRTATPMAYRCPPELLLRNAIRRASPKPVAGQMGLHTTSAAGQQYRAAVCTELNKPVQVQKMDRNPLTAGEVRVKVNFASVNFADLLMTKGLYQEKPELPFVLGTELSGLVSEVAPDVTSVQPGDHVIGVSTALGAFAEELVLPEMGAVKVPSHIPLDQAAALLISYGTAYMALKHRANIQPGETVLVTAAAGAVGLATVDLAKNIFNANVIGACGGEEKCALIMERGAMAAIDYNKDSVRSKVKELTNGKGADIIVDSVGGKMFDECVRCIAFEGRLLVIGFASGDIPKLPVNHLLLKSASAMGVYWGSYGFRNPAVFAESIKASVRYLAEGKIKPHISATFALNEVNEAFKFISCRKSTGKVLISTK